METNSAYLKQALDVIDSAKFSLSNLSPSQWAEKYRIMPQGSPFPGPYSFDRTPYMREPLDCLSQDHPSRIIAIMKGSQIGVSTGLIENGIGWIISESPAHIMLLMRDQELAKIGMDRKVDQMIDSCGLRPLIKAQTLRKKNQRSGDTSKSKEFAAGSLMVGSIQTPEKYGRQVSIQIGLMDDFEAAPQSDKDAGSTRSLIETRFDGYYTKMKLFYISTPEIKQTSNIEPIYLMGDQRKFHVPCPRCQEYIELKWRAQVENTKDDAGISYKLDGKGRLVGGTVGYVCQKCGEFFTDRKKKSILIAGKWVPSVEAMEEGYYSYHISSLYAPAGMYDWEHYVYEYIKCHPQNAPVKYAEAKTFHNTTLGLTWEEFGERPRATQLSKNTRNYPVGIIPDALSEKDGNGKIVLITCACDLNGLEEDARIDYEVVAWTEAGATYSIEHGSIGTFVSGEKRIKNPKPRDKWTYVHGVKNSVWPVFEKVLAKVYQTDVENGRHIKITIAGVDTGHYTKLAHQFIENTQRWVVALRGEKEAKVQSPSVDKRTFKVSPGNSNLYNLEIGQIKDDLAESIKLVWSVRSEVDQQPLGFMNFPTPERGLYTMSSFFSHYQSEQREVVKDRNGVLKGTRWVKIGARQNHFWDVRVYNMALRDIFLFKISQELKVKYLDWLSWCRIINKG